MSTLASVTDSSFESEVKQSVKPVVIDFWAEWCGPCKALGPILESAAINVPGVKVLKMNVDANVEVPVQFGIRSIPTMIAFKDGEPVSSLIGLRDQATIETWLKSLEA